MPRYQQKNIINNSQDIMSLPESIDPTTAIPEHFSTVEAWENDLKNNFMEIEVLKEEMNRFLK